MSAETSEKRHPTVANIPFVAQIDSSDCGAACLSMAAQYFKVDLILSEARQMCGNDVSGQRLCSVARKIGVDAQFVKKSFSAAIDSKRPFIAHWEGNHWVVVAGIKGDLVKIADPASGIYWLELSEAEKFYSDYCIILSDDLDETKQLKARDHVLLKCLIPFRRTLILSTFVMILMVGVEMFIPYSFQRIIDEQLVAREESFQWLFTYAGLAAVIVIFGYALLSYLLYRGAVKSENLVLDTILSKWMNLPENFYKGRSFAELRARLESAFQIKRFLVVAAGGGLFALLEVIAVFAMLEYYGVALKFAILLLPTLILTFYTLYLAKESAGLFKFAKDSFLNTVDDITQGIFSIRASSNSKSFKDLQLRIKEEMYDRVTPLERKLLICEKGAHALGITAWILLFFHMCRQYVDNEVSSGVMFAVIILAALALNALSRIISHREKFENAALIYDYLNDVLDTTDEHLERKVLSEAASLKVEDSSGKTFELPTGEKCLLSGEGANILLSKLRGRKDCAFKFEINCAGEIFKDFEQFPQLSEMEAHAHIFNASLAGNIGLSEQVDQKKAKWCLRLALGDHLLEELPQGINTKLSKGKLSPDDEKKVLLARCLYRERPVYVLEDLSSFLEPREQLIFTYHLQVHLKGKTIILVDSSPFLAKACTYSLSVSGEDIL
ncbi:MAG: cysteine peptidase family C39 domain-containing protein [Lentisphaeraceae bacterium]|nr:cysteine peptidase family C39 domain-containing protein [Lentisphaeraceae bacterium]